MLSFFVKTPVGYYVTFPIAKIHFNDVFYYAELVELLILKCTGIRTLRRYLMTITTFNSMLYTVSLSCYLYYTVINTPAEGSQSYKNR